MEGGELFCFAVLVCIVVAWVALATIDGQSVSDEPSRQIRSTRNELRHRIEKGLAVACDFDDVADEHEKQNFYVARVKVSGTIVVPVDNQPVNWLVQISDETDGANSTYPLYCEIPEFADEDSLYEFRQKSQIPYVISEVENCTITGIPLFALCGPEKGARKWRVHVSLVDTRNDERVFSCGSCLINYHQRRIGYLEWKEHSLRQDKNIANLAIAMAAADHEVSKRETSIIRGFFSERFERMENSDERKLAVTECLQSTLTSLNSGERADELIKSVCRSLRKDDDVEVCQTAFELCARVAAADDVVDANEEQALHYIAAKLDIDSGYVKEVRDREIRIHMYGDHGNDLLRQLGGPSELSTSEQREWLQDEYEKWRPRQSHADPEVATEATLRIDTIMTLLTSLDK